MERSKVMNRKIELYTEPLEVLEGLANKGYTGMSDFELSFLCGAIKKFRPKKVVEIGVAAGGTTSVILNCLKLLNYNCEMYSVDICRQCYFDTSKNTGFTAEELLKEEPIDNVRHQFMLGNTIASSVDRIGGGIDFVILDTMHALPGELLDFISVYPYLDKRAAVVFHDVGQSQLGIGHINGAPYEYASLVTLSAINGEKYLASDENRIAGISNIGAVRLDENSDKSIDNLFMALFINWNYIPDKKSLEEYCQRILKEYGEYYYHMFEQAIECNTFSLYRRRQLAIPLMQIKHKFEKILKEADKVYIYGAGKIGKKIEKYINNFVGKDIAGFIVSSGREESTESVSELHELKTADNSVIILGLDEKYHLEVLDNLYQRRLSSHVFPYNGVGFREMMQVIEYENSMEETSERYNNVYAYEQCISCAAKGEINE